MLLGGGITSLTIGTSDNWSATTDATWLSLGQDGSTLYITAEANDETTDIREAEVSVVTDSYGTATVEVRQEPAAAPTISISCGSSDSAIDSEGGSFTAVVSSNYDWTASFAQDIDGWKMSYDTASGKVTVFAGANSGDPITGKVIITAGSGSLTAMDEFTVKQMSRAENPYYMFVDDWDVTAAKCYYGGKWYNDRAVYTSCTISEYSYAGQTLKLANLSFSGLSTSSLVFDPVNRAAALPLGCRGGYVKTGLGIFYTMYLAAFNESMSTFKITGDLILTLSEDGSTISVSGIDADYPVIGWVGHNDDYGYISSTSVSYIEAPLTFTRTAATASSASVQDGFFFVPESEVPFVAPAHLPKGFVGEISSEVVF